jgi:hypothetical protein
MAGSELVSSKADTGTLTCCSLPRVSVKRKSTNLTSASFTMFITSATVLAINESPKKAACRGGGRLRGFGRLGPAPKTRMKI